jgi:biopolymer transport protein ExbD
MKIRKSAAAGSDKVEMQMTPMIDIVFQLLTFFLMSFKIATQEGDFNIKMPMASAASPSSDVPLPPIKVRLQADSQGNLASIKLGDNPATTSFDVLHKQIMNIVGTDTGPNSLASQAEVELDCDYNLRYANAVSAITAISGYLDPATGTVVKLIEKLKFAPPKAEQ